MRKLVITQNITLDGSIEMLGDWFDPQSQDEELLAETHRQDADCDAMLLSNVLHDWDEPVVRQLLSKSFDALPSPGLVVIHDAFLNAARNGPLHVAEYSVLLMHSSEGRCYATSEMERYLNDAGFRDVRYLDTAAARGVMTARK